MYCKEYKLGELFCGAGGMSLGASLAGFKPRWGIDCDKHACETHSKNIDGATICTDVRTVDFSTLEAVDCLAFGFPCNDFSTLGKKSAFDGKYGPLYRECVRALKVLQPKVFVAENVRNLVGMQGGTIFKQIRQEFEDAGYNVYYKVVRFEYHGVPQSRHRVIIIGVRKDINAVPHFPQEQEVTTCRAALEEPFADDCSNNGPIPMTETDLCIIPKVPAGCSYKNIAGQEGVPPLKCGKGFYTTKYRRLDKNKPSSIVVAAPKSPIDQLVHATEDRWLTNRETARLQTFPDDFVFCGTQRQIRIQIGMAVPPRGIQHFFEEVRKLLDSL